MVEPSKPEDWSNPKHAPEIGLEGETGTMKTADENTTKMAEYEYESGASTKIRNTAAKSCKGLLYYSSRFKAHSKNPICVGFTRSLPNYPEVHLNLGRVLFRLESKEDRTTTLANFRFACVGYSAYADRKGDNNFNGQETRTELPGCIGLQAVLHDGHVNRKGRLNANAADMHALS
ncbi:hypothetical protein C2S52_021289 [Perilla frutescens var. hirtella]|nr:hypothetical protein C2S52_021289 [Perilla frutescens var. hirtella]